MITSKQLREMCTQTLKGKAYYRPYICNGDISNMDIFFVGINPATPICEENLDLDAYILLLNNYEKFVEYYKAMRLEQGKTEFSRTRLGINSFMSWLRQQTNLSIAETNINAYPTANLKQLKHEPKEITGKGKRVFRQLLLNIQPKIIILHGKDTVGNFSEMLCKEGLCNGTNIDLSCRIEQMEECLPLTLIRYPNGSTGTVLACRHFMYYGKNGDSFVRFKENVKLILNQLDVSPKSL